jgi:hypothetical protein
MSTDLLHRAAQKIRQTAWKVPFQNLTHVASSGTAEDGDWQTIELNAWTFNNAHSMHLTVDATSGTRDIVKHLLMWSPTVAFSVADVLDRLAEVTYFPIHDDEPELVYDAREMADSPPVRLARQILGEGS